MKLFNCLLITLLSLPLLANAAQLEGKVIKVSDGDTLTLLDSDYNQHKVRLAEIDAPENSQSFGKKSKQSLSSICLGKNAAVTYTEKDRYKRFVGHVKCDGTNANVEQLNKGMAWAYPLYVKDASLYQNEKDARINKKGLWIDADAVPPWDFRRAKKNNKYEAF